MVGCAIQAELLWRFTVIDGGKNEHYLVLGDYGELGHYYIGHQIVIFGNLWVLFCNKNICWALFCHYSDT